MLDPSSPAQPRPDSDIIASAARAVAVLSRGMADLTAALDNGLGAALARAVRLIAGLNGRLIVTGVGKSGLIGAKIAATLASTGTPASFVHAADANHGDLGMITPQDAILVLSWSGETTELNAILAYAKRFDIPVIALTSGAQSTLGLAADICLALPKAEEACPHGLAPTTSTLLQLAIGDALAVALLEARGFTALDFHGFHPGGKLGASLTQIGQIMHRGEALPLLGEDAVMRDAVLEMTRKGFGCVAITGADGRLSGIITDGDLRRHMGPDLLLMRAGDVMTRNPRRATTAMLAVEVLQMLNEKKITAMIVVDGDGRPEGIVHLHDLLRIGVA
ncbi:MAG: KpsF/GutQ family sugar-phosphate isomerase [Rhizobiaceae bacterium]|nr:KpsF/GutQ family sugar-phosphate isomerase [Rhizobiaceae bacterium]